jgi:glycosyltransferase involved in cell wall biosynthesis
MSLKNLSIKKTCFVVTGAVNEKNGANGSMIDLMLALKKSYNVEMITIGRPPIIGLIESLLHSRIISYCFSLMPIYQFILKKPSGIFLVANTTKEQILYFKNKHSNAKLMMFQTGDIKNNKSELDKIDLIDYILFESPGQMDDFKKVYNIYKNKALLLLPTIKENKFLNCYNKKFDSNLLKNNKEIIFTIVGSIQDRKNQLQAIEFCKILKEKYNINLKLFVVGPFVDAKYKQDIIKFVKSNNLENLVVFTGFQKEYARFLCNSHIVLSFSKEEGLSTIIRESLYLGKLIIATNILGNLGTLDENNSIVIDLKDKNELLVDNTLSILSDQKKVTKLMNNAKNRYLEKHTYEKYLTTLKKIMHR